MSGAVLVPDLSANQVAVKALKQFIAVKGFAKSILQCDGHSGLLNLQEQVAGDLSLPTQVSPPYSRQSQGAIERFTRLSMVKSEPSGLDSQLITQIK